MDVGLPYPSRSPEFDGRARFIDVNSMIRRHWARAGASASERGRIPDERMVEEPPDALRPALEHTQMRPGC
jgi:hypothetical protein